jgi:LysM repeat protein
LFTSGYPLTYQEKQMSNKSSAQKVISSYRKRQQMGPYIVGGLAILLVVIGIIVLVIWLTGPNRPGLAFVTSATPTLTDTPTKTSVPPTFTATITLTQTSTVTVTATNTPSGPFEYTVKAGETCWDIAVAQKVDLNVLIALNPNYGANCTISPGDVLLIPTKNQVLPSDTPVSLTTFAPGTKITVVVKSGDTVRGLALLYNSTVDSIVKTNNLANANAIQAGQKLIILVNIVTPVPTSTQTKTPGPGTVYPPTRTPTSTATTGPTATQKP